MIVVIANIRPFSSVVRRRREQSKSMLEGGESSTKESKASTFSPSTETGNNGNDDMPLCVGNRKPKKKGSFLRTSSSLGDLSSVTLSQELDDEKKDSTKPGKQEIEPSSPSSPMIRRAEMFKREMKKGKEQ